MNSDKPIPPEQWPADDVVEDTAAIAAMSRRRSWKQGIYLISWHLARFLDAHSLSTRKLAADTPEEMADFVLRVRDLTLEGRYFYREGVQKWYMWLDRGDETHPHNPDNTSVLERELKKLRKQGPMRDPSVLGTRGYGHRDWDIDQMRDYLAAAIGEKFDASDDYHMGGRYYFCAWDNDDTLIVRNNRRGDGLELKDNPECITVVELTTSVDRSDIVRMLEDAGAELVYEE